VRDFLILNCGESGLASAWHSYAPWSVNARTKVELVFGAVSVKAQRFTTQR
jgi:hypothetical protein